MSNPNNNTTAMDSKRDQLATLVKDSTDKNRQFFTLYIGLWLYVLSMVVTTTDVMLLEPSQGIKLPFVDVSLPLFGFYWVAPLFLIAIHFNLLQNLESHHYKLMRWRFSCGGTVARKEISAFMFDFASLDSGSIMQRWVKNVSNFLFLYSGPIALGILMWRFTDYQDIVITSWHLFVFFVDSYLVWLTVLAFEKNNEPDQPLPNRTYLTGWKEIPHLIVCEVEKFLKRLSLFGKHLLTSGWSFVTTLLVLWQFIFMCWFVLADDFPTTWNYLNGRSISASNWIVAAGKKIKDKYPPLFSLITPTIVLEPNKSVWLPSRHEIEMRATMAGEKDLTKWWLQYGEGLSLAGRHLRGFSAIGGYLPKLRLDKNSDLQGADFSAAQLQRAVLSGAKLQGAMLDDAQLQGSILIWSHLEGASMSGANLQEADLYLVQLQGADLSNANLQGANLNVAQLPGADLHGAKLQGANLAAAQLQGANLSNTRGDSSNEGYLKENEVFTGAELQGENLSNTYMQGIIINQTVVDRNSLITGMHVSFVYPDNPKHIAFEFYNRRIRETDSVTELVPYKTQKELFWNLKGLPQSSTINSKIDLNKVFINNPEVVWKKIIPSWDKNGDAPILLKQEVWLYAARGLRRNYENVFGNKNESDRYHPKYIDEINKAFCNSAHFQSLCEKH